MLSFRSSSERPCHFRGLSGSLSIAARSCSDRSRCEQSTSCGGGSGARQSRELPALEAEMPASTIGATPARHVVSPHYHISDDCPLRTGVKLHLAPASPMLRNLYKICLIFHKIRRIGPGRPPSVSSCTKDGAIWRTNCEHVTIDSRGLSPTISFPKPRMSHHARGRPD